MSVNLEQKETQPHRQQKQEEGEQEQGKEQFDSRKL